MKTLCAKALLASCFLFTNSGHAAFEVGNINFTGYGSIVAGKTMGSDEVFTADFYDVGQYTDQLSFKPESVLAIQANGQLSEKLSFTAQLVAKGVEDFQPEFDWYYLSYQATDDLKLMAGRRTIPMYYYSEFYEVGYAYSWMRPPANLYWWQITFFNGIHAEYNFTVGDLDTTFTGFYGNENSIDNVELNFYFPTYSQNDENWKDIIGFNWTIYGDNYDLRFVYFNHGAERTQTTADGVPLSSDFSQNFFGVGGSVQFGNLSVLFDYNFVERDSDVVANSAVNRTEEWPTFLVSLVYNMDEYQPYVSFSRADHTRKDPTNDNLGSDDEYEQHELISVGLRYNFAASAAFKVQLDQFDDQGHSPRGWDFHGDSTTISAGIDFVF